VVIGDVREEPLEGGECTAQLIARRGGDALFMRTDVATWRDIDALISAAVDRHGRLDVMVNNAATASGTGLLDTTPSSGKRSWASTSPACSMAASELRNRWSRRSRAPKCAAGSSIWGRRWGSSTRRTIPLRCQQGGRHLSDTADRGDYAPQLIVCNCISPGKIVIERPNFPPDPELENARWRTPWPRLGRPQDIANAAVFLASDRATYMTGSNLVVDGAG